jgi:hypothetical protein
MDGTNKRVPTNESGAWSATVSGGCAYRARLYWRSDAGGPLLANVSELPRNSHVSVNVSEEEVSLVLFREFSHSANVTISVVLSAGVKFSVDAVAKGSLSLGFLEVNAANRPGADFIVPATLETTAPGSHAVVYRGAKAFRVVDVWNDSVIYLVPTPGGRFEFLAATDALTMSEAIARDGAANINPYVQIAGHGIMTISWDVRTRTGIPLVENAAAFGTELRSTFGVDAGAHATFTVKITNEGDSNNCYVLYRQSFEFHLWFYSPTGCP